MPRQKSFFLERMQVSMHSDCVVNCGTRVRARSNSANREYSATAGNCTIGKVGIVYVVKFGSASEVHTAVGARWQSTQQPTGQQLLVLQASSLSSMKSYRHEAM